VTFSASVESPITPSSRVRSLCEFLTVSSQSPISSASVARGLFRLLTEPRRLAHRYLIDNSLFIGHMLQQVTGLRKYSLDL
jgi:hypothetical protein